MTPRSDLDRDSRGDRGGLAVRDRHGNRVASRRRVGVREFRAVAVPGRTVAEIPPVVQRVLIQEFVERRILMKDLLVKADKERGRFRSFLLKSFSNFIVDYVRRRELPVGVEIRPLSEGGDIVAKDEAQSDPFTVSWAQRTLDAALARMREECRQKNRAHE